MSDNVTPAAERPDPETMTQKALLVEIVTTMRQVSDALAAMSSSPMLAALLPRTLRS